MRSVQETGSRCGGMALASGNRWEMVTPSTVPFEVAIMDQVFVEIHPRSQRCWTSSHGRWNVGKWSKGCRRRRSPRCVFKASAEAVGYFNLAEIGWARCCLVELFTDFCLLS
ncbi:uncharacterized protein LOC120678731 [Panicum virgatum]|uniref:uncharacterized protein LOC120678731 n=1 Tax=Panicum virgatum TaxID=38727 RepID=UPI0019D5E7F0|nr:uncharacterized protein LOC120678731 [Panicum virgatum]